MFDGKFFLYGAAVLVVLTLGMLATNYLKAHNQDIDEDLLNLNGTPTVCATVTTQCKAKAQTKAELCDMPKPENQLREQLSAPLQSGDCVESDKRLRQQCPYNCELDPGSTIVIPGQITVRSKENEEEHNCIYTAIRPVTISANCTGY